MAVLENFKASLQTEERASDSLMESATAPQAVERQGERRILQPQESDFLHDPDFADGGLDLEEEAPAIDPFTLSTYKPDGSLDIGKTSADLAEQLDKINKSRKEALTEEEVSGITFNYAIQSGLTNSEQMTFMSALSSQYQNKCLERAHTPVEAGNALSSPVNQAATELRQTGNDPVRRNEIINEYFAKVGGSPEQFAGAVIEAETQVYRDQIIQAKDGLERTAAAQFSEKIDNIIQNHHDDPGQLQDELSGIESTIKNSLEQNRTLRESGEQLGYSDITGELSEETVRSLFTARLVESWKNDLQQGNIGSGDGLKSADTVASIAKSSNVEDWKLPEGAENHIDPVMLRYGAREVSGDMGKVREVRTRESKALTERIEYKQELISALHGENGQSELSIDTENLIVTPSSDVSVNEIVRRTNNLSSGATPSVEQYLKFARANPEFSAEVMSEAGATYSRAGEVDNVRTLHFQKKEETLAAALTALQPENEVEIAIARNRADGGTIKAGSSIDIEGTPAARIIAVADLDIQEQILLNSRKLEDRVPGVQFKTIDNFPEEVLGTELRRVQSEKLSYKILASSEDARLQAEKNSDAVLLGVGKPEFENIAPTELLDSTASLLYQKRDLLSAEQYDYLKQNLNASSRQSQWTELKNHVEVAKLFKREEIDPDTATLAIGTIQEDIRKLRAGGELTAGEELSLLALEREVLVQFPPEVDVKSNGVYGSNEAVAGDLMRQLNKVDEFAGSDKALADPKLLEKSQELKNTLERDVQRRIADYYNERLDNIHEIKISAPARITDPVERQRAREFTREHFFRKEFISRRGEALESYVKSVAGTPVDNPEFAEAASKLPHRERALAATALRELVNHHIEAGNSEKSSAAKDQLEAFADKSGDPVVAANARMANALVQYDRAFSTSESIKAELSAPFTTTARVEKLEQAHEAIVESKNEIAETIESEHREHLKRIETVTREKEELLETIGQTNNMHSDSGDFDNSEKTKLLDRYREVEEELLTLEDQAHFNETYLVQSHRQLQAAEHQTLSQLLALSKQDYAGSTRISTYLNKMENLSSEAMKKDDAALDEVETKIDLLEGEHRQLLHSLKRGEREDYVKSHARLIKMVEASESPDSVLQDTDGKVQALLLNDLQQVRLNENASTLHESIARLEYDRMLTRLEYGNYESAYSSIEKFSPEGEFGNTQVAVKARESLEALRINSRDSSAFAGAKQALYELNDNPLVLDFAVPLAGGAAGAAVGSSVPGIGTGAGFLVGSTAGLLALKGRNACVGAERIGEAYRTRLTTVTDTEATLNGIALAGDVVSAGFPAFRTAGLASEVPVAGKTLRMVERAMPGLQTGSMTYGISHQLAQIESNDKLSAEQKRRAIQQVVGQTARTVAISKIAKSVEGKLSGASISPDFDYQTAIRESLSSPAPARDVELRSQASSNDNDSGETGKPAVSYVENRAELQKRFIEARKAEFQFSDSVDIERSVKLISDARDVVAFYDRQNAEIVTVKPEGITTTASRDERIRYASFLRHELVHHRGGSEFDAWKEQSIFLNNNGYELSFRDGAAKIVQTPDGQSIRATSDEEIAKFVASYSALPEKDIIAARDRTPLSNEEQKLLKTLKERSFEQLNSQEQKFILDQSYELPSLEAGEFQAVALGDSKISTVRLSDGSYVVYPAEGAGLEILAADGKFYACDKTVIIQAGSHIRVRNESKEIILRLQEGSLKAASPEVSDVATKADAAYDPEVAVADDSYLMFKNSDGHWRIPATLVDSVQTGKQQRIVDVNPSSGNLMNVYGVKDSLPGTKPEEVKNIRTAIRSAGRNTDDVTMIRNVIIVHDAGQFVDAKGTVLRDIQAHPITADGTLVVSRRLASDPLQLEKVIRQDLVRKAVASHERINQEGYDDITSKRLNVDPAITDGEAPHGRFGGRPIIGERSSQITEGVYVYAAEGVNAVVVTDKDPHLQKSYQDLKAEITKKQPLTDEDKLVVVNKFVQERMPYWFSNEHNDIDAAEVMNKKFGIPADSKVSLGAYLVVDGGKGGGVCLHQGLYASYLMEQLQKDGLLDGKVGFGHNILQKMPDKNDSGGHAWSRVTLSDGRNFIVDPAQNYVGPPLGEAPSLRTWEYSTEADRQRFEDTPL